MTLPRIYSCESLKDAVECRLGEDNIRYLKTVLRMKPGDPIIVFDGFGHEFQARIESFHASGVAVRLEVLIPVEDKTVHVTLAQAIPKAGKMDLIVKTAAELGADVIIPFTADRSVGRLEEAKAAARVARWQKIVLEAARCSRSVRVTAVEPVLSFPDMLERATPPARKLIFWEEEDRRHIRDVLTDQAFDKTRQYFVIVGPEGGLSRDEVDRAKAAGFVPVSLGKQILKVETAAAAILSIIQYEKGIFSRQAEEGEK